MSTAIRTNQRGFGAIMAIVVLVILALFGAAMVTVGTVQQVTSAQDLLVANAWQTARTGNEWGLYKARNKLKWTSTTGENCDTGTRSAELDLTAQTGFRVTVTCTPSQLYNEGETVPGTDKTVRIYTILAVACNAATCPDKNATAANPGYVERSRRVQVTDN
ncbi:hypothetical protein [uncultured Propionivibrio sp.]|uniref:hypothetical protein n=1 Tax=uncultured Propionivibrio sp. TaxID=426737 RepID=UPI0029C0F12E|nr:hypothetical protein [uncultured Propionivibrio sp.]